MMMTMSFYPKEDAEIILADFSLSRAASEEEALVVAVPVVAVALEASAVAEVSEAVHLAEDSADLAAAEVSVEVVQAEAGRI